MKAFTQAVLNRISRITSSGFYLAEIDGLRALSIVMVMCGHLGHFGEKYSVVLVDNYKATEFFRKVLEKGGLGVSIFFVLSGFIISLPFIAHHVCNGKKIPLGSFYLRRLTRLEPPYIISLIIISGIRLLTNKFDLQTLISSLGASLIYQHNLIFGVRSLVNPVTWSLEIEFQFYFLAPFILLVFLCKRTAIRRFILILATVLIMILRPQGWRWDHSVVGTFEYFVVGILIADIYLTEWKSLLPRKLFWDVVAIIGWCVFAMAAWSDPSKLVHAFRIIGLFLAISGTIGGKIISLPFKNPWVAAFGGMCYTFYLYHSLLLDRICHTLGHFIHNGNYFITYILLLIVSTIIVLPVCSGLFLIFEKPFMRRDWTKNLFNWSIRLFRKKS